MKIIELGLYKVVGRGLAGPRPTKLSRFLKPEAPGAVVCS
jgi:hypothetical protein